MYVGLNNFILIVRIDDLQNHSLNHYEVIDKNDTDIIKKIGNVAVFPNNAITNYNYYVFNKNLELIRQNALFIPENKQIVILLNKNIYFPPNLFNEVINRIVSYLENFDSNKFLSQVKKSFYKNILNNTLIDLLPSPIDPTGLSSSSFSSVSDQSTTSSQSSFTSSSSVNISGLTSSVTSSLSSSSSDIAISDSTQSSVTSSSSISSDDSLSSESTKSESTLSSISSSSDSSFLSLSSASSESETSDSTISSITSPSSVSLSTSSVSLSSTSNLSDTSSSSTLSSKSLSSSLSSNSSQDISISSSSSSESSNSALFPVDPNNEIYLNFGGGSNTWIDFGDVLDPGTGSFTIECWHGGVADGGRRWSKRGTGAFGTVRGWQLGESTGWNNAAVDTTLGFVQISGGYSGFTNNWVHLAMVWNASTGKLSIIVDGVETHTATNAGAAGGDTSNSFHLTFGCYWNNSSNQGQFFKGSAFDLRMWHLARTPAEIAADKDFRLKGNEAGLVGYWPCDEGSGNTVFDLAGNNDGTITNPDWVNSTSSSSSS